MRIVKVTKKSRGAAWGANNDVEIYVVYKPTKEIISSMKGKIDP